ncbi:MAG: hypothetical protein JWM58_1464 [Rhizobium sp.]|nr:hypothetical protein [Rhizobium sp.]
METTAKTNPTKSTVNIFHRSKGLAFMISKLRNIVRHLAETDCDGTDAWHDPLSHPSIRSMTPRELADLPLSVCYGRKPK